MVKIVGVATDFDVYKDGLINEQYQLFDQNVSGYFLDLTPCLRHSERPRSKVYSDFSKPSRRILKGGRELLFRAVGDKSKFPVVWDISLGLGRDANMLSSFGYQVSVFERNPWLFCLNKMAMIRNSISIPLFRDFRQSELPLPNTIYFDPMYPKSKKNAATTLEVEWLREIVGEDVDAAIVAREALDLAKDRLIVKRPRWAEPLIDSPKHQFVGKSVRYDMYLTKSTKNRPMGSHG